MQRSVPGSGRSYAILIISYIIHTSETASLIGCGFEHVELNYHDETNLTFIALDAHDRKAHFTHISFRKNA
jgi:hypothetical protein